MRGVKGVRGGFLHQSSDDWTGSFNDDAVAAGDDGGEAMLCGKWL